MGIYNDSKGSFFIGNEAIQQFHEHYKRLKIIKTENEVLKYNNSAVTQVLIRGE